MDDPRSASASARLVLALKLGLLAVWATVSFVASYFARDLQFSVLGWPFSYWFAAQGAPIAFICIVTGYAWAMNRLQPEDAEEGGRDALG